MHRRSLMSGGLATGLGIGMRAATAPLAGLLAGCGTTRSGTAIAGATMGTGYRVLLATAVGDGARAAMRADIESTLAAVDGAMSTYRAESELSRLNDGGAGKWLPISAMTHTVLSQALQVSALSGGAFDVSVGPLVDLWGFGPAGTRERAPGEEEIESVRAQVGLSGLELSLDATAVRKPRASTRLDLSGIAKGYALDRVADRLRAAGFDDYLVEIGGELRARGVRADGAPWRVGIEQPLVGRRAVQRVVELGDRAIASSGDYRNFFEHEKVRYSHTIDPRTGWPVRDRLAAVSVIADDAMTADAQATAILVLGADAGAGFAALNGIAAHLMVRGVDGLQEHASAAMQPHLAS